MDFDSSVSETSSIHNVCCYSFNKLLKLQVESHKVELKPEPRECVSEDTSPCSTESLDQFSFYPSVEFPLIKVLDKELKNNFKEMEELFPLLPCEVSSRKFRLGKIKPGLSSTLVIIIDKLLTEESENYKVTWFSHAKPFVKELSKKYEIVLVSTYSKEVTEKLMMELDNKRKYVTSVIGTDSMIMRESYNLIDLRIFEDRNPAQIILLSNSIMTLTGWLENAVYLRVDSEMQDRLKTTEEFLMNLPRVDDVRPLVKRFSGLVRVFKIYTREKSRSNIYKEHDIPSEY